jgi:hypothetical protein
VVKICRPKKKNSFQILNKGSRLKCKNKIKKKKNGNPLVIIGVVLVFLEMLARFIRPDLNLHVEFFQGIKIGRPALFEGLEPRLVDIHLL